GGVVVVVGVGGRGALGGWGGVRLRPREEPACYSPRVRAVRQGLLRILGLGCGASALAAGAGYTELAAYLGVGLFYAVFVAFVAAAVRVVIEDVMTIGLARGPLARLHAVARHRALIERRTRRAIDVLIGGLWLWFMLRHFDLSTPLGDVLQRVLDARLRLGELDLPVARVLGFVAVVIGVYLATRVAVTVLEADV